MDEFLCYHWYVRAHTFIREMIMDMRHKISTNVGESSAADRDLVDLLRYLFLVTP
jgi:hypothetical protein